MDYQSNNYDGMGGRYTGNRNAYCDLCFRRCRGVYHVIERGDTLYSLGKRYHVSVADLMRANPYVNVYNLRIGEELCIPVRPQPRMEEENMDMDRRADREISQAQPQQNGMVQPENDMVQRRARMQESEQTYVSEEELKAESRSDMENQFSENDALKDVLEKTGLSMSDFMEFLAKKMD